MVWLDAGARPRSQRATGDDWRLPTFDKAIAAFSIANADQTERDYEVFKKAAREGKLEVVMER